MNDDLMTEAEVNLESDLAAERDNEFDGECCLDNEPHDFRNDVEADADALASAGFGTDEDYCHDTPLGDDFGGE